MNYNIPPASFPRGATAYDAGQQGKAPPKYIFDSGIKKINPAYKAWQQNQASGGRARQSAPVSSVADPRNALAIVSSMADVDQATAAQHGAPMRISESTVASLEIIQDEDYVEKFGNASVDGGSIVDGLGALFEKFEVPLGLVNKLLVLSEYKLHFIVDDSGSMQLDSDVRGDNGRMITRWQEAEQRLKQMMYVMAYVPCEGVKVSFMNRRGSLELNHHNKTPDQFRDEAIRQIAQAFSSPPRGATPTLESVHEAFACANGPTAFYLMTDGVPNSGPQPVANLVLNRPNPASTPFTFLSCTNQDEEAEWMKQIEERAPYTAELDDFEDEKREVFHDQGGAMPYSYGMWLISNLCAAMHPDDLDAMDESVPFAKRTLDNMLGYETSPQEYGHYFSRHAQQWGQHYNDFANASRAREIPAVAAYLRLQQGASQQQGYPSVQSAPGQPSYPQIGQQGGHQWGQVAQQPSGSGYGYPNQGQSGGYNPFASGSGQPPNQGNSGASGLAKMFSKFKF